MLSVRVPSSLPERPDIAPSVIPGSDPSGVTDMGRHNLRLDRDPYQGRPLSAPPSPKYCFHRLREAGQPSILRTPLVVWSK